ncbi:MAG: PIN domain-containing protein [Acidobacteriota bacterium]|nr:PIN domain-containing protein [Acidobacteriota bacterium]
MRVYLDACRINRLTDDQGQTRIRQAAEAVELILRRMRDGEVQWISSEALADEIDRNPNVERRLENATLLALASENIDVNDQVADRAANLEFAGYGAYDALHLACAEAAQADVLFTTDDGFIRRAARQDATHLWRASMAWHVSCGYTGLVLATTQAAGCSGKKA